MHDINEDRELCQRLRLGDEQALAELFGKYQRLLLDRAYFHLRNIELAEDIVQDTFVKIWSHRKKLPEDSSLKGYLLKMVTNRCVNTINQQKVAKSYINYTVKNTSATIGNFEIERKELQVLVRRAVSKVPVPTNRRALEMLYLEQKSIREIAEETNTNSQVVSNRVYLALKFLRKVISKNSF